MPHFGTLRTGIRTVAEVIKEVNIQERGLGFSVPNTLGQSLRHDVRCVKETFQFRAVALHYSFNFVSSPLLILCQKNSFLA